MAVASSSQPGSPSCLQRRILIESDQNQMADKVGVDLEACEPSSGSLKSEAELLEELQGGAKRFVEGLAGTQASG